jgi:hypothetical protein
MLCRTSRQNNKNVTNWEDHHLMWVDMWNAQRNARVENDHTPDNDEEAYLRHLEWLRKEYRVIHKGAWTRADCLDVLPSEAADGAFNNSIRETIGAHLDYGPLHDRVVCLSFVSLLKYKHVSFLRECTELWRCMELYQ